MVCGLVDTIGMSKFFPAVNSARSRRTGSYTFAKTLEYKAKQGLNSSKEVTVVPPHEYQERFVGAMDDYFLACPGMCDVRAFVVPADRSPSTVPSQTSGPGLWITHRSPRTTEICQACSNAGSTASAQHRSQCEERTVERLAGSAAVPQLGAATLWVQGGVWMFGGPVFVCTLCSVMPP